MFELHAPSLHSGGWFSLDEASGPLSQVDQSPIVLDCVVHPPDGSENVPWMGVQEARDVLIQRLVV